MKNRVLLVSAWLVLILSISSMIFNLAINGDSLLWAEVSRNLFSLGGAWQGWRFNASPAYFLEMPLYFLGYNVFPFLMDAPLFVTIIEGILIAVCSIWLAKIIKPNLSDRAKVILIILVSFISLTSVNSNLLMYFSRGNYHVSSLVFALLSLGCLIQYLATAKRCYGVLLILWVVLAIPSDMIYFISFYLTAVIILLLMLGHLFFFYKYDFSSFKRRLIWSLGCLLVGLLIGKFVDYIITYNQPLIGVDLNGVGISFTNAILATSNSFKLDNMYTFIFSCLVVIALIYLIIFLFKSLHIKSQQKFAQHEIDEVEIGFNIKNLEDYKLGFVGIFLIFLLPINMGCLIFASHGDSGIYRYYMFPLTLIFIQATLNLDRSALLRRLFSVVFLWLILITFSIIIVLTAVKNLKNDSLHSYRLGIQSLGNDVLGVTHCLEQLDGNPIVLRSGVAEYWHARPVTLFLKKHNYILNITGVAGDLHPLFWLATKDPMLHPNKYHVYYNFVIIIKDKILGPLAYDFTPENLGKVLPKNYNNYACPNDPRFEIWVYTGNELNDLIQANVSEFFFDRDEVKQANWLGMQLPGKVGQVIGTARVANSKNDRAGFLTLGPSIGLHRGRYRINIHYSANNTNVSQANSIWKIGKFIDPSQQITLAQGEFPKGKNSLITVDINVSQRTLDSTEVRVWFSGHGGDLKISSISIEKLGRIKK